MKISDVDEISLKIWNEGINSEIDGERGVWVRFKTIEKIIEDAPTVDAVPKNMMFHIAIYNAMTEEHSLEEMTLEEILDKFTDEGYPNALNALDALEDER